MFKTKKQFKALTQSTSKKKCKCGYIIRGEKHEEGKHHKLTKPHVSMPQRGEKYPTNVGDLGHGIKETKRK